MTPAVQRLWGGGAVFLSAFCFYFSTVVIRWARDEIAASPAYFAFARLLLGFLVVSALMAATGRRPRPRRYHLLVGRTLSNCLAVYCFYMAVIQTSVTEANLLNMTYPVFVALLAWFILREQRDPVAVAMVLVAFAGIALILSPGEFHGGAGSLWGLASGLFSSTAIVYLNVSRRVHDVNTVLFFMFGLGAVVMLALFHRQFYWPDPQTWRYLFLCGASGVAGQFLLTLGFRFVTAVEGSIVSSTRILLAALLGPLIAGDEALNAVGWAGALLLFLANAVLSVRHRPQERRPGSGGS